MTENKIENPYKTLGLDSTATAEDIKKVYRQLAIQYHPDKLMQLSPEERRKAEETFKEKNEAYKILNDPLKKVRFDTKEKFKEKQWKANSEYRADINNYADFFRQTIQNIKQQNEQLQDKSDEEVLHLQLEHMVRNRMYNTLESEVVIGGQKRKQVQQYGLVDYVTFAAKEELVDPKDVNELIRENIEVNEGNIHNLETDLEAIIDISNSNKLNRQEELEPVIENVTSMYSYLLEAKTEYATAKREGINPHQLTDIIDHIEKVYEGKFLLNKNELAKKRAEIEENLYERLKEDLYENIISQPDETIAKWYIDTIEFVNGYLGRTDRFQDVKNNLLPELMEQAIAEEGEFSESANVIRKIAEYIGSDLQRAKEQEEKFQVTKEVAKYTL
ncbi:DnaJ domain-containing protein [Candidatus Woesearchaeota archaeon]|nr:DnaJ domain-containing protein [Candidatus Woesearchaeota archaeon]